MKTFDNLTESERDRYIREGLRDCAVTQLVVGARKVDVDAMRARLSEHAQIRFDPPLYFVSWPEAGIDAVVDSDTLALAVALRLGIENRDGAALN